MYDIFGLIIFQIIMILTDVTVIEYAQKKADNTSISMRKVGSMAVYAYAAMIVFGFTVLAVEGCIYIIALADTIIIGIYTYIVTDLRKRVIACIMTVEFVSGVLAMYLPVYLKFNRRYEALLQSCVILFGIYIVLLILIKIIEYDFDRYELCMIGISVILSVAVIVMIALLYVGCDNNRHVYIGVGIACVLTEYYIVFNLIKHIKEKQVEEKNNDYMVNEYRLQKQYLKSVNELYENTRRMRHDIKNQLRVIDQLIMNEEDGTLLAHEHIEKYIGEALLGGEFVKTDNKTVNAVVNAKLYECTKNSIDVSVELDSVLDTNMTDIELCSIIGNIFDNAIEAEMKNYESKRKISLSIHKKNNLINILISNRIEASVLKNNPELKTDKPDEENHGLGVHNIKAIVEKYNGYVDIYEKNDNFYVNIII